MYQPASFRHRDALMRHPPYGLFLDPHRGQHNWTAASARVLLAMAMVLIGILLVFVLGPH